MKRISVLFYVLLVFLCACGGSSSDDYLPIINAGKYYYQPVDGDVFTYDDSLVQAVDEGAPVQTDYERVSTFTQVDENLKTLYLYGDDISGTYLLETSTQDGVDAGYTYYSLSDGTEIIHDDLSLFSTIEFSIRSGNDEPDPVLPGWNYSKTQDDFLFSTAAPDELKGLYEFESTIIPEATETITITAGTYECLRFEISGESVKTIEDTDPYTITTSVFTGYQWYAEGLGLVKIELDYETEITGPGDPVLITSTYTSELKSVD